MFLLRPDSSFSRKSKTFWWKTFQRADEDTLDALAKLGKELISTFTLNLHKPCFSVQDADMPTLETIENLEMGCHCLW